LGGTPPDRILALACKLNVLAAGDSVGLAIRLAVQLGLEGLFLQLPLLCGKWVGPVISDPLELVAVSWRGSGNGNWHNAHQKN
jgi:hypothetical protein